MRFLITGGCGFLGSNLAAHILKNGDELFVFDNLFRFGASENLKWLRTQGDFHFFHSDIRSYNDVETAVIEARPDIVFHLSGQVAMTTSLTNPRLDFEINVIGGNNVLESVRKHAPKAIVIYSSTNKVYGDLENINYEENDTRFIASNFPLGFDETLPLHFQSPYGCSKGATDQYMLDYARMFGIKTVVFRHSSIFGGRQFSTIDQGWVGWFCKVANEIKTGRSKKPFSISGNGKQVRDILFADDLIRCYFSAIEHIDITKGNVYNIGGGYQNSMSLLELFTAIEQELDIKMIYEQLPARQSDQKVFIANIDKARRDFKWQPQVGKQIALKSMLNWVIQSAN